MRPLFLQAVFPQDYLNSPPSRFPTIPEPLLWPLPLPQTHTENEETETVNKGTQRLLGLDPSPSSSLELWRGGDSSLISLAGSNIGQGA